MYVIWVMRCATRLGSLRPLRDTGSGGSHIYSPGPYSFPYSLSGSPSSSSTLRSSSACYRVASPSTSPSRRRTRAAFSVGELLSRPTACRSTPITTAGLLPFRMRVTDDGEAKVRLVS